ncbi:MAG: hypothetical protein SV429_10760, partial [Pseudomonadota bacterium]|nr:hypothetical protein [Pseudomonadota bacterium]
MSNIQWDPLHSKARSLPKTATCIEIVSRRRGYGVALLSSGHLFTRLLPAPADNQEYKACLVTMLLIIGGIIVLASVLTGFVL